jgi:hypothetical protein
METARGICAYSTSMDREAEIKARFEALAPTMNERQLRLWLAAEAKSYGRGGVLAVFRATGVRPKRVSAGVRDLENAAALPGVVRRPGAGRKRLTEVDPDLWPSLDALIDPVTRGDPESPLRWTSKSLRTLARELGVRGHRVSASKVGQLLHDNGYSLQAMKKTLEGAQHPDRDAQFEYINEQAKRFQAANQPVVSVDTKKKELVGGYKNAGREWQPKGEPARAPTHDFPDPNVPKAIPYGVYDVARNEAWVSVGMDHDTADFAVAALLSWWRTMGRKAYPSADRILITADAGGSNGYRRHGWKLALQRFADQTKLQVSVSHFPPGTSKWNKIEHRLFSAISQNWRGRPLSTHETVVSLIANTRTTTGLRVRAKLDKRKYPTGKKVTRAEMKKVRIQRTDFHGEWNYTINSTPREHEFRN